jgi:hypothetical protein
MKSRQGYKGYVIEARSCELKDGGFSAEFSVVEHDASSVTETAVLFAQHLPDAGVRNRGGDSIDVGFERGSVVVNG